MSNHDEVRGRVAVITGAASGLGREFALHAAGLGMNVVLADVQADALEATRTDIEAAGGNALACFVDVSDGTQVEALAARTLQHYGAVHYLFNNAGVGSAGLIWENSVQDWNWTLGVNLWGVIHGVRTFVPLMLEAAAASPDYRGHVINTASMAGLITPPLYGVYNVSKHAVVALSETLYHDLGLVGDQVGCSVLCPYYVPTGIHASHRNRPQQHASAGAPTHSQRVAQAMVEKAVTSGKVSAADFARHTFEAIRQNHFYVVSHPQALDDVRLRAEDITTLRNPSDPAARRPGMRESLLEALRGKPA